MFFTLTPLFISEAQADPDTAAAVDFIEATLEGAAPLGYDRNFLDPGHRASRKTPAFVDARLAALEQLSLDAGCPSVLESAWAGRYGAGSAGSFQAVDAEGTVVEGTYLNGNSGLIIDGLFGATAFGDVESDWGAGSAGGMVRKLVYGLGPDKFVAGFAVADTTRNGYVFGVQGSCSEAWEVYADWFGAPIEAPEPPAEWVHQFGTPSSDTAMYVATTLEGDVLVGGETEGNLTAPHGAGPRDVFVRRVNPEGTPSWTFQLTSPEPDNMAGLVAMPDGSTVLAGTTTADFGGAVPFNVDDAFLARVSSEGTLLWTRQYGNQGSDQARALDVGGGGELVLAGSTGSFGGVTSPGGQYTFVMLTDALGNPTWTHRFVSPKRNIPWGVSMADDGSVVVAGQLIETSSSKAFVRKLDSSGAELWTREIGLDGLVHAQSVDVGPDGSIAITGVAFGNLGYGDDHTNTGAFVARLHADGNVHWVRRVGSDVGAFGRSVLVSGNGNVVVGGLGNYAFVASFESDGNLLGVRQVGSETSDQIQSMAALGGQMVAVAGGTFGDIDGNGNQGGQDAFVARIATP